MSMHRRHGTAVSCRHAKETILDRPHTFFAATHVGSAADKARELRQSIIQWCRPSIVECITAISSPSRMSLKSASWRGCLYGKCVALYTRHIESTYRSIASHHGSLFLPESLLVCMFARARMHSMSCKCIYVLP